MPTTAALAPIDAFAAHDDPINHVAFSRDGKFVATSDTGMIAKVWHNRELLFSLDTRSILDKVRPTERIRDIRFSPGSQSLYVAAGENVAAYSVNPNVRAPDWVYSAPRLFAFLIVSPTSMDVSGKGSLAAAFDNGTIAFWNEEGVRETVIRHNAAPRHIVYLPDERIIGSDSFSLSLWRKDQRKPVWHRPSSDRIYGIAASSDGKYVAARKLYITSVSEVATGAHVVDHKQGRGLPLVAFGHGSDVLAIGSQHAIDLYDIAQNTHARLALDDAELISVAFSPDSKHVAAGCSDGRLRTWVNPLFV